MPGDLLVAGQRVTVSSRMSRTCSLDEVSAGSSIVADFSVAEVLLVARAGVSSNRCTSDQLVWSGPTPGQ